MSAHIENKEHTRNCPVCWETIPATAIMCQSCGAFLKGRREKDTVIDPERNVPVGEKKTELHWLWSMTKIRK